MCSRSVLPLDQWQRNWAGVPSSHFLSRRHMLIRKSCFCRWKERHSKLGTVSQYCGNKISFVSLQSLLIELPHYNDDMNEILDLQRDFTRLIWPIVKNTPVGFARFHLPLSFCQKVVLRSMQRVSRLLFDTATFCVGVLAVEMRTSVTHGIAGSTGSTRISNFFLAFWTMASICSSSGVHRVFWGLQNSIAALLSCEQILT